MDRFSARWCILWVHSIQSPVGDLYENWTKEKKKQRNKIVLLLKA